jgi:acetolactate synthase regulatory subunit
LVPILAVARHHGFAVEIVTGQAARLQIAAKMIEIAA